LLLFVCTADAADKKRSSKWLFGEFSNNLIYSNVGKRQLEKEIKRLQEFELCIQEIFPIFLEAVTKPTVFIIPETRDELYDFLPYWNDRLMNVSGVFMNGESVNVILMDGESLNSSAPDSTILHEYVHKLLEPMGYTPPWVGEGLAEALAHFEKDRNYYYFGRNIGLKLAHLRTDPGAFMNIYELFRTTLDSTEYHIGKRQAAFYTTAWLVAHHCLNTTNDELRNAYGSLWAKSLEQPVTQEMFIETFGYGYVAFQKQLKNAVHAESIAYRQISVKDIPAPKGVMLTGVDPDQLNLAKALAVIRSGRPEDLPRYLAGPPESRLASTQDERSRLYLKEIAIWRDLYSEKLPEENTLNP
jgi:hypothetical protein